MNDLWTALADNNVLIAPGWMFAGDGLRAGAPDEEPKSNSEFESMVADDVDGIGHFRLAFSFATHDTLRKGVKIFAETVVEFFEDK